MFNLWQVMVILRFFILRVTLLNTIYRAKPEKWRKQLNHGQIMKKSDLESNLQFWSAVFHTHSTEFDILSGPIMIYHSLMPLGDQ